MCYVDTDFREVDLLLTMISRYAKSKDMDLIVKTSPVQADSPAYGAEPTADGR